MLAGINRNGDCDVVLDVKLVAASVGIGGGDKSVVGSSFLAADAASIAALSAIRLLCGCRSCFAATSR